LNFFAIASTPLQLFIFKLHYLLGSIVSKTSTWVTAADENIRFASVGDNCLYLMQSCVTSVYIITMTDDKQCILQ